MLYTPWNVSVLETPAQPKWQLLGDNDAFFNWAATTGWIDLTSVALTYASANSVTTASDLRGVLSIGDPVMLVQGASTLLFYVISVSATTVGLYAGVDYALTNTAISGQFYSKSCNPVGFPSSFSLGSLATGVVGGSQGASANLGAQFYMIGREVNLHSGYQINITSGSTSYVAITLPTIINTMINGNYNISAVFGTKNPIGTTTTYGGTGGQYDGANNVIGQLALSSVTSEFHLGLRFRM